MLLFIDVETTGLPRRELPLDHPGQPHIVQLALILTSDEEPNTSIRSFDAVIKPGDWEVPLEATAVHGVTDEYARSFGTPLFDAMRSTIEVIAHTRFDPRISVAVGHNVQFDLYMLQRDMQLVMPSKVVTLAELLPFCTMRALTPIMKLPSRLRNPRPDDYKFPSLREAYQFMFDHPLIGAHNAMTDCLAARDIYVEGRARRYWR